jgi:hypothetical protein
MRLDEITNKGPQKHNIHDTDYVTMAYAANKTCCRKTHVPLANAEPHISGVSFSQMTLTEGTLPALVR